MHVGRLETFYMKEWQAVGVNETPEYSEEAEWEQAVVKERGKGFSISVNQVFSSSPVSTMSIRFSK